MANENQDGLTESEKAARRAFEAEHGLQPMFDADGNQD
jgi:hypothetical protein